MYTIPVWQMVREAVISIGGSSISNADIKKYIYNHYGVVNSGTINAQIIVCSVNQPSRINFPENHKPRISNGQYDFLYNVDRGLVTLYDPDKHGHWEIAIKNGKPTVRRLDGSAELFIQMEANYPRAINQPARRGGRIRPDIEKPCSEVVKRYLAKWDTLENYKAQERALNKLFWESCPNNTNLDDVLLKVATLNTFYSTNIYNVFAVARHIVNLNIDGRLGQGDESLVMDIASGHGVINKRSGKEIEFFSFATKYCSHHRPEVYPIYDRYVEEFLVYLGNTDGFASFHREALRDISVFKQILLKLQKFYQLESFNLKEIDQYLWQYGKEKFPNTYGRKQTNGNT